MRRRLLSVGLSSKAVVLIPLRPALCHTTRRPNGLRSACTLPTPADVLGTIVRSLTFGSAVARAYVETLLCLVTARKGSTANINMCANALILRKGASARRRAANSPTSFAPIALGPKRTHQVLARSLRPAFRTLVLILR